MESPIFFKKDEEFFKKFFNKFSEFFNNDEKIFKKFLDGFSEFFKNDEEFFQRFFNEFSDFKNYEEFFQKFFDEFSDFFKNDLDFFQHVIFGGKQRNFIGIFLCVNPESVDRSKDIFVKTQFSFLDENGNSLKAFDINNQPLHEVHGWKVSLWLRRKEFIADKNKLVLDDGRLRVRCNAQRTMEEGPSEANAR